MSTQVYAITYNGDFLDYEGQPVSVEEARIYTGKTNMGYNLKAVNSRFGYPASDLSVITWEIEESEGEEVEVTAQELIDHYDNVVKAEKTAKVRATKAANKPAGSVTTKKKKGPVRRRVNVSPQK